MLLAVVLSDIIGRHLSGAGPTRADGLPLILLAQQIMVGADTCSLVALPVFMLAAEMMRAGITRRIIVARMALIGWVGGGLAMADAGASVAMASFSGSAVADASMVGSVTIPSMKERGHPAPTAAAVTAGSSGLGVLIPPSIPMRAPAGRSPTPPAPGSSSPTAPRAGSRRRAARPRCARTRAMASAP